MNATLPTCLVSPRGRRSVRHGAMALAAVAALSLTTSVSAQDLTTRILNMLSAGTDGTFGLYLKEVGGGVLANSQETFAFYPASTIKVLHHLHAMQQVEGGMDLDATNVQVCPSTRNCGACAPACPGAAANAGVNCSDNANSMANCGGFAPVSMSLRCVIQRMMLVSDNQAPNALQNFFGGGDASAGRAAMNATASAIGMSGSTALVHKFACGNISNNPFNTSTLEDFGILFEGAATDPAVLMPGTFNTFRSLMLNETNDSLMGNLTTVVNQEANLLGMAPTDPDVVAFLNGIQFVQKFGNIGTSIVSIAGWVRIPRIEDCNPAAREYVFGLFIVNATNNTIGNNLRPLASELLRDAIADAIMTVFCDRPPELSVPSPIVVECNEPGGIEASDPQIADWLGLASAVDACGDALLIDDAPTFFPAACDEGAETQVVFTAFDECGNTTFDVSTVTVVDTTGPEVTVPEPLVLECNEAGGVSVDDPAIAAWLAEATAVDICGDADVTHDAPALFPSGCEPGTTTEVTFTGIDTCGNETDMVSTVTVEDTTAPEVECELSIDTLWPPNHKFVDVGVDITTSDVCDPAPAIEVTVTSDEPAETVPGGDGNDCPDAIIGEDNSVQLRAERSGAGDGRVYTITVTVTDSCGNESACHLTVEVPKQMNQPAVDSGGTFDATDCD